MIPICEPQLYGNEWAYLKECLDTNWISSKGRFIDEFERKFAAYCGVQYGVTTTSGTTALHLALATLGVGPGDEVIIPTMTIISCANAVTYTGAKIVLADSEAATWNIDPESIREKITPRTKAIMVVHTYGHPCDMDAIRTIADGHGIPVVEDAAEAHGAEYKGRRTGSLGDIAAFSFYSNKIITTGEGGMVVTNNPTYYERAGRLKDLAFEKDRRFWHTEVGFNYRMTNLQAAIGLAQLEHIEESVACRRRNARWYEHYLAGVPGLTLAPEVPWAKNTYWYYSVLIEDDFGVSRDEVIRQLREQGIDSRTFFYPIHQQPVYRSRFLGESLPIAESLSRRGINLPSSNVLTENQISYIAETIGAIYAGSH